MHCQYDPYDPYDPYCPNCPTDPDAPTHAGCLDGKKDPCAIDLVESEVCHTGVCNDKFADLPTSTRISLIGIVGRCFYRFANKAIGFLVSDESGQYITNRPCIKIPFLKSFLTHPTTGEVLQDVNGDPLEGPVPEFDSLLVADPCGCQNRVQGTKNKIQEMRWNGCGFDFVDFVVRENNPLLDPDQVPIIDPNTCPAPLIATLIPTERNITGECGDEEIVRGFTLGGIRDIGVQVGIMEMWAGRDDNVPAGYLIADGTQYDVNDYPDLFQAIGFGWGGNGGNLFRVPDMRGLIPKGVDNGEGRDTDADDRTALYAGGNAGDAVGSYQDDQIQCFGATYDRFSLSSTSVVQPTGGTSKTVARFNNNYTTTPIAFTEGGCGDPRFGDETRPKNVYVHYIIRAGCPPEIAAP